MSTKETTNARDRLRLHERPKVQRRPDVTDSLVTGTPKSKDIETSRRSDIEMSTRPDLQQDVSTHVRSTYRIDPALDRQLRLLCAQHRIYRDALIEALIVCLDQHAGLQAKVLAEAHERSNQRKESANRKRTGTYR